MVSFILHITSHVDTINSEYIFHVPFPPFKIVCVQEVGMYVCVCVHPQRLLLTSSVMWHDIDPILLVKQGLLFIWQMYIVGIISTVSAALQLKYAIKTNLHM